MKVGATTNFSNERVVIFDHIGQRVEYVSAATWPLRLMHPESLCPDLLSLDYIGEADTMRGRVVRAFFWAMRAWPKPKGRRR